LVISLLFWFILFALVLAIVNFFFYTVIEFILKNFLTDIAFISDFPKIYYTVNFYLFEMMNFDNVTAINFTHVHNFSFWINFIFKLNLDFSIN